MSPDKDSKVKAMAAVQAIFDRYHLIAAKRPSDHVDYDYDLMKNVQLLDAGPNGTVLFELYIGKRYSNLNDVMHGGAAGVIFGKSPSLSTPAVYADCTDMCTTTALGPLARPGYWYFLGGVTRTLNISYLKAVPIGTTVRIRSWVTQVGKTMAMIRGEMTSVDGKVTYCTVEHHKMNVPTKREHMVEKLPYDLEQEAIATAEEKAKRSVKL